MIWYKQGLPTQLAITATCFSAFLLYVLLNEVCVVYV